MEFTININGRLMDLSTPQVMGILNVTPDSFYAGSRRQTEQGIIERAQQMLAEGATVIDVGGCSTRPDAPLASEKEERERLQFALDIISRELPDTPISVDTFRPDIARMVVEEYGVGIINDAGGSANCQFSTVNCQLDMFRMVARLRVPYILMSQEPTMREMLLSFSEKLQRLRDFGARDVIIDPGFGFGKTLEQNYKVMGELEKLHVLELPILVGVSRKSMIFKKFGCTPDEALNGTTVLNTIALMKGAHILRVHDVREAVECVKIIKCLTV